MAGAQIGNPQISLGGGEGLVMTIIKNFGVSSLAASLAHIPHHPLYTLKNQMMYHGKDFRTKTFISRIMSTNGRFLFQGVLPRSIGIAPEKALKMFAWENSLLLMESYAPQCPQTLRWGIAGSLAGAATTIIGCPSERAMVLAQIQKKGFMAVLRDAGIRGLYHGGVATLCRDITFNQSLFVLRAIIMRAYEQRNGREPSAFVKILWGLVPSVTAGVLACPFDVAKTKIQGKELNKIGEKNPLTIMVKIVRTEGFRYLFKGLVPRLVAVPLYMSVFMTVNEELEKLILHKRIIT